MYMSIRDHQIHTVQRDTTQAGQDFLDCMITRGKKNENSSDGSRVQCKVLDWIHLLKQTLLGQLKETSMVSEVDHGAYISTVF